jgi:hypothetical protein
VRVEGGAEKNEAIPLECFSTKSDGYRYACHWSAWRLAGLLGVRRELSSGGCLEVCVFANEGYAPLIFVVCKRDIGETTPCNTTATVHRHLSSQLRRPWMSAIRSTASITGNAHGERIVVGGVSKSCSNTVRGFSARHCHYTIAFISSEVLAGEIDPKLGRCGMEHPVH